MEQESQMITRVFAVTLAPQQAPQYCRSPCGSSGRTVLGELRPVQCTFPYGTPGSLHRGIFVQGLVAVLRA